MKAKNCLIFGGSGQIGRNLIRKLTKNNYKVTVVTRNLHQKSYIIKMECVMCMRALFAIAIAEVRSLIQISLATAMIRNSAMIKTRR